MGQPIVGFGVIPVCLSVCLFSVFRAACDTIIKIKVPQGSKGSNTSKSLKYFGNSLYKSARSEPYFFD